MKVFLSHASDQKPLAEKVAFSLRDRGFQVFLDKDDLPAGKSYDAQIEAAVNASDMMVYLISPQSVTRGRYTLTELEYARRRWGTPHNRVLPVMAEPTGMAEIPEFLKAVTLLQPQGNAAAEISAAVAQLGSQRRHQALMVLLACGLVSGVLSAVSQLFGSAFNPGFLGTPIIPGLLLGVALAGAVFVLLRPSVVGLLLIFAVTQVSWHLAVQSAVAVHQEFKVETRTVKTELGGTDDVFKVKFDPSMILPGLVGGLIGGLGTWAGVAGAAAALRHPSTATHVTLIGAAAGILLCLGNLFLLYVVWQTSVAVAIGQYLVPRRE